MAEKKSCYKRPYKAVEKKVAYKPKRGKLAPLMTEEKKKDAGICELSCDEKFLEKNVVLCN